VNTSAVWTVIADDHTMSLARLVQILFVADQDIVGLAAAAAP
jgi:hypothetical protein